MESAGEELTYREDVTARIKQPSFFSRVIFLIVNTARMLWRGFF
jgi:hypothetical protein